MGTRCSTANKCANTAVLVSRIARSLYGLIEGHLATPLYRNAYYFMVNTVATSGLGFIFWKVVATRYEPTSVGLTSALMGTVGLVTSVANLGLGFGAIHLLPEVTGGSHRKRLINSLFTVTGTLAVAVGGVYLALVERLTPELGFINDNLGRIVFFLLFVLAWAWYGLSDQLFTAYRRGGYVLTKNLIANTLKIALVIPALVSSTFGIASSIAASMWASVLWVMRVALPRLETDFTAGPDLDLRYLRRLTLYSTPNYFAGWLTQSPNMLLPILVLSRLGSERNAEFFIAWMIVGILNAVGAAVSGSLLAESVIMPQDMASLAMRALVIALTLQAVALAILVPTSNWLLTLFGPTYATNAHSALLILMSSSLGYTVWSLAQTVLRVRHNFKGLQLVSSIPIVTVASVTLGTPALTLESFAWSWLAGVYAAAGVGLALALWPVSSGPRS